MSAPPEPPDLGVAAASIAQAFNRLHRQLVQLRVACALVAVLAGGAIFINGCNIGGAKEDAQTAKRAIPKAKTEAKTAAKKEARKVAASTRRIVIRQARTIVKHEIIQRVGKRGATGRPATMEEVRQAVADLCQQTRCIAPITVPVAADALRQCIAGGGCGELRGPGGENGQDGRDGRDAEPVTDDRVDAAVARRCMVVECRGPQGEKGDQGDAVVISPCVTLAPDLGYQCAAPPPPPAEDPLP